MHLKVSSIRYSTHFFKSFHSQENQIRHWTLTDKLCVSAKHQSNDKTDFKKHIKQWHCLPLLCYAGFQILNQMHKALFLWWMLNTEE